MDTLRAGLENSATVPMGDEFPMLREAMLEEFDDSGQTFAEARVRERFGITVFALTSPQGEVLVNPPAATTIRQF